MVDVTFWVYRTKTERFEDLEGRQSFARKRAQIIHALSESLDFEVKDWGLTEQLNPPKEVVAIIVALGSAGVFTALVKAWKIYWESKKLGAVKLILPDGRQLDLTRVTLKEATALAKTFGLQSEPAPHFGGYNDVP